MYEYYLWVILRESTVEADEGSLVYKLAALKTQIAAKLSPVPKEPVYRLNVEFIMQFSEAHNHRADVHSRLLDVLNWVAKELPGSFGLVYWHDDEIPGRASYDGYRVIRIARGTVEDRYDPFLSPIVPYVED